MKRKQQTVWNTVGNWKIYNVASAEKWPAIANRRRIVFDQDTAQHSQIIDGTEKIKRACMECDYCRSSIDHYICDCRKCTVNLYIPDLDSWDDHPTKQYKPSLKQYFWEYKLPNVFFTWRMVVLHEKVCGKYGIIFFRKRSELWQNFIQYCLHAFSCRLTTLPHVPSDTKHPV